MADKQKIRQHLALTASISLSPTLASSKGNDNRKGKIMDHLKKSRG